MQGIPEGFENEIEEGPGGWAVWKSHPDGDCPNCRAKANKDDGPLHALQCPECYEPGCDECFPSGRGCVCPSCEEDDEE